MICVLVYFIVIVKLQNSDETPSKNVDNLFHILAYKSRTILVKGAFEYLTQNISFIMTIIL